MKKYQCEPEGHESGTNLSQKLTAAERKAKKVFDKAVRRWYKTLLIDPVWKIGVVVVDEEVHGDAFVDIGTAEYYVGHVHIARPLLSLPTKNLERVASNIACHELLHIATADMQRAVITATDDNEQMQNELRYRYEQLVSRLSMILAALVEEDKYEPTKGKDHGSPEEMLRVPEVPPRDEGGGGS